MSALLLKLTLAPALVAAASLLGRRFGPRVGGWVVGFPLVAGPVLWFYAREQGAAFAAHAAAGTLMGVLSVCVFLLVYVWSACRAGPLASVALGWVGFAAATAALAHAPWLREASWPTGLVAACAALAVTRRTLPRLPPARAAPRPRHDLALRLGATALLVVALTRLADVLGPGLSGLVTPFPVATTILVVFAHREGGAAGVVAAYGGFIPSLFSFSIFCAAVSFGLGRWTPPGAFALALGVTAVSQAIVLRAVGRPAPPEP